MLSYIYSLIKQLLSKSKFYWITFSTSLIFLITILQRYYRLRHEYEHYDRRHQMLQSITTQKQDELENLTHHIHQSLLILEDQRIISIRKDEYFQRKPSTYVYDHGDHLTTSHLRSSEQPSTGDDTQSDDDDPLLQRLKLTKPSRLKSSPL